MGRRAAILLVVADGRWASVRQPPAPKLRHRRRPACTLWVRYRQGSARPCWSTPATRCSSSASTARRLARRATRARCTPFRATNGGRWPGRRSIPWWHAPRVCGRVASSWWSASRVHHTSTTTKAAAAAVRTAERRTTRRRTAARVIRVPSALAADADAAYSLGEVDAVGWSDGRAVFLASSGYWAFDPDTARWDRLPKGRLVLVRDQASPRESGGEHGVGARTRRAVLERRRAGACGRRGWSLLPRVCRRRGLRASLGPAPRHGATTWRRSSGTRCRHRRRPRRWPAQVLGPVVDSSSASRSGPATPSRGAPTASCSIPRTRAGAPFPTSSVSRVPRAGNRDTRTRSATTRRAARPCCRPTGPAESTDDVDRRRARRRRSHAVERDAASRSVGVDPGLARSTPGASRRGVGRRGGAVRGGTRPPRATAAAASAGDAHTPSAMPASDAAPSTVVSGLAGRRTVTPSTSAWNWQSTSIALAPPSTRSSVIGMPAASQMASTTSARLPRHRLHDRAHEVRARRAAGQAEHGTARVRVEPRRTEPGERGHEHHAVGVVDARRERSRFRRRVDDAEAVAQPLHRGAGHEDRSLHRVGDGVAELPRDRGEQSVDRRRVRVAQVHEHERTGAVGVLGHARREARLAEQRGLLVAGDARHRHREPRGAVRDR